MFYPSGRIFTWHRFIFSIKNAWGKVVAPQTMCKKFHRDLNEQCVSACFMFDNDDDISATRILAWQCPKSFSV